ncbi:hypothetical protein ACFMPD_15325 [Sedimentitalea sp. HM32M-2]|uniref:hypothetical protein n=1 Tax=Sedimentitalea sp. HM32M-2 TaxID=3351566 RepID=UPI00363C549A
MVELKRIYSDNPENRICLSCKAVCWCMVTESEVKGNFFQNLSYEELAIIVAMVAVTLASLAVLCHVLKTAGRDFDDDPALAEQFCRDAPYHLLQKVMMPDEA